MTDLWLITRSLSDNSLGRTYCLWLLAQANGWTTSVLAPEGNHVWPPLAGTQFAEQCTVVGPAGAASISSLVSAPPALAIGVKAVPETVALLSRLTSDAQVPNFFDVDDPDIEVNIRRPSLRRRIQHELLHPGDARIWRQTRQLARVKTKTVSNPTLAAQYGGTVIPHVRIDPGPGAAHESTKPLVAFVGTNRPHKGLTELRAAVAGLRTEGFRLLVTDDPPADASPWEQWVGSTTLQEGLSIVQRSDIVAAPSLRYHYAAGQLPVKVIDAMLAARPVIVSDIDPLPWAVGSGGVVVQPGSVESLTGALRKLADPMERQRIGAEGRSLALTRYTVEAQKDAFRQVCEPLMARTHEPHRLI